MEDKWTVEYSLKQGCFHFDKLSNVIEMNQEAIAENIPSDYRIIALCDSDEECDEFAKKWRAKGYAHNYNPDLI
jgi:hypothetical protein